MTLKEIQERKAEIAKRMIAINEIATRASAGEEVKENIEELNQETDKLIAERDNLNLQELNVRSSIKFDDEAKMPSQRAAADQKKEALTPNSETYRKEFMDFVLRGKVGENLRKMNTRDDAFTVTSDVTTVIVPTVITEQLFKTNKVAGTLFERVRKTAYPFGVKVKTSATEFEIEWVAERNTSTTKKGATTEVTFTAFKGLIKFAQSLEVNVTTLPEFEQAMQARMLEGAINSFDKAIVAGLGSDSNQPTGILVDASYTATKSHKFTDATISDHAEWLKAFAKVPLKKKPTTVLVINDNDWLTKIVGMKDETGRVVAFETTGFNGLPQRVFLGRPVITLEGQGLNDYDSISAAAGSATTSFAFFATLEDYYMNINKAMSVRKYIDEDTDDIITKLSLLADGKLVDVTGAIPCYKGV